jgi:hypothetical protein
MQWLVVSESNLQCLKTDPWENVMMIPGLIPLFLFEYPKKMDPTSQTNLFIGFYVSTLTVSTGPKFHNTVSHHILYNKM